MRRTSVCFSLVVLAGVLSAASAQAQVPAAGPASSDGTNMGTARFTSANSAHGRGLGIGAATMLNGTSGALVTWGTSGFHLDGLAGRHRYVDGNATTSFTLGVRPRAARARHAL